MSDVEILSEKVISLNDLHEGLEKIKKRDKELNFRANKTLDYVNTVNQTKKAKELKSELEKLEVLRLKEKHIIKIMDIMPTEMDSLKMIFSNEPITLKQEDLEKILSIVKKYA